MFKYDKNDYYEISKGDFSEEEETYEFEYHLWITEVDEALDLINMLKDTSCI